jgi:diaminopimelate decarboxylase
MSEERTASGTDVPAISTAPCPLLPEEDLVCFVERFLVERKKFLDLSERHGLPLYVLEPATLRARAAEFRNAFCRVLPHASFYFAVKSNNHPEVSRILLECGFGLDVSSGLELQMAVHLGAEDIVFSGPAKTEPELDLAAQHAGRTTVLIDSFGELHLLQAVACAMGVSVQAGVRLTTLAHGLWRKFGIPLNQLVRFFSEARACSHVHLRGLQFHTSWNLTPQAQVSFLEEVGSVLRTMPQSQLDRIEFLDIGGGFWPSQGEWLQDAGTPEGQIRRILERKPVSPLVHYRMPVVPISDFADALAGALQQHIPFAATRRICFEPGRWVCNDAMHLLIRVVDKKDDDLVITDAGTNAVGWERFETDYFPVLNLSRPAFEEKPCAILGSLCTPHDVWGYAYWGEDIQPGDVLLIPTQGAYTYSLRQHFIKPLPEVVTMPNEGAEMAEWMETAARPPRQTNGRCAETSDRAEASSMSSEVGTP